MSDFVWGPSGTVLAQSGAAQSFVVGNTFTGLILGGGGSPAVGYIYSPAGGAVLGGLAAFTPFFFHATYIYFTDGGLVLGGTAKLPAKFAPDPDFVAAHAAWADDITFPGEAIGGN